METFLCKEIQIYLRAISTTLLQLFLNRKRYFSHEDSHHYIVGLAVKISNNQRKNNKKCAIDNKMQAIIKKKKKKREGNLLGLGALAVSYGRTSVASP